MTSIVNGAVDAKMDGSVLEEKPSFKIEGLHFSSKLNRDSCIVFIATTFSKKIGALILLSFFLEGLVFISINLPDGLA